MRRALKDFSEITVVDLDTGSRSGKLKVKEGFDVKGTLTKLAEDNEHIAGWKMAE